MSIREVRVFHSSIQRGSDTQETATGSGFSSAFEQGLKPLLDHALPRDEHPSHRRRSRLLPIPIHPLTSDVGLIALLDEIVPRPLGRREVHRRPIRQDNRPGRLGLLLALSESVLTLLEVERPHGSADAVGDAEQEAYYRD